MTTLEKIKKAGWAEVEQTQDELSRIKERVKGKPYEPAITSELSGKIKGMVYILNMIR